MTHFKKVIILTILILTACLSGFTSDIYTPSFFSMAQDLNTPLFNIQRSMSVFMLSLAISQFAYGPLSEVLGRRPVLMIGIIIMIIGSFISMFASHFSHLMLGRLIQGAGAGACACLWRSIFRDIFNNEEIARYGGYLGIVMVYIVAASPFLGGHLETSFGWRTAFVACTIYGLTLLFLVYSLLPETNIHRTKENLHITFFKQAYGQLLNSPTFIGYCLCVFCTYGAFFSWFVVGPVLYKLHFNLPPQDFGLINLTLGGTAMTLGGLFNGRYVARLGQESMLKLGWWMMFFSGGIIVICDLLALKALALFLICIFIFLFGVTLIWPNAFSRAFAPFGAIAGYAGSLYSAMQLGGGAIIGWASTFIPANRPLPLAIIFMSTAIIARLVFEYLAKRPSISPKI